MTGAANHELCQSIVSFQVVLGFPVPEDRSEKIVGDVLVSAWGLSVWWTRGTKHRGGLHGVDRSYTGVIASQRSLLFCLLLLLFICTTQEPG